MEWYFISDQFGNYIFNIIVQTFPSLNSAEQHILHNYLLQIVDIIAIKFNFDINNKSIYEAQLKYNNGRDLVGLLLLLLPHIDDETGKNKKELKSFDSLYIKKRDNVNYNINMEEPKYEYTNLQYGRCIRNNNTATEIKFSLQHLEHNFILLIETIKHCTNKLYVNWIHIRPITMEKYQDTKVYKETHSAIKHWLADWDYFNEDKTHKFYSGLDMNTIYDCIANSLFHNIKNIKWLIYDIPITGMSGATTVFISMLFEITKIDDLLNGVSWDNLSNESKDKFTSFWNGIVQSYNSGSGYDKLDNIMLKNTVNILICFFDKYSKNKNQAIKKDGYISFKEQFDEDELEFGSELTSSKVFMSANSLKSEYMYDFIMNSIEQFKNTWYSTLFMKVDNVTNKYRMITESEHQPISQYYSKIKITGKNIYNFAKSLTHFVDNKKYLEYPKYWRSLTTKDKNTIITRLNKDIDKSLLEWFNISRYFKKTASGILSEQEIIEKHISLYKAIKMGLADIIFKVLIFSGTLSEFVPDSDFHTSDINKIKEKLEPKLKEYGGSNYFLTNKPYNNLELVLSDKSGQELKIKYLDSLVSNKLKSPPRWFTFYALDWVSQISFFHKYLNNRIIYVTGSTGVGKSTQIPKLFLYALKSIDYNLTGKIACTQPRIPPVRLNAERISGEMGVPIVNYNGITKKNVRTDNYYIQYKYKGNDHSKYTNKLSLTLITDGMLDVQIDNPILKNTYYDNELNTYVYQNNNIFDIIMIDEAHEHNKNMDIILTKMKYACYYNNQIKLVIMSATMDEDEPTYRRYYREINDNKMYPFNYFLVLQKLDRINVDRRIHISPPGETTQFKITEIEEPNKDPNQIVLDIIKKSIDGDILLFQPGRAQIMKSVEFINDNTPSNIIALPYYKDLPEIKKTIIDNISERKSSLTIPKNIPFDEDVDERTIKKVPAGTYTRVVIVATTIAEASITIDSLRYVVDTGIYTAPVYNWEIRSSTTEKVIISNSSRLQRKGRVGRVAAGTVYYNYNIKETKDKKKQFDIATADLNETIYDLLQENSFEHKLFDKSSDPNITDVMTQYNVNMLKVIIDQYFINGKYISYIGNPNHYDYQNNIGPYYYWDTGYNKDTLIDSTGTFYIVHPDELDLDRNILGNIINKDKNWESQKLLTFWNINTERFFIGQDKINYWKTIYGKNIYEIKKMLELLDVDKINYVISYAYSRKYECNNEFIKVISMLDTINGSPYNLAASYLVDGKFRRYLNKLVNIYGDQFGDINSLLKIANKILSFVQINTNVINNKIKDWITIFKSGNNLNTIDESYLDKFLKLKYSGKFNFNDDKSVQKFIKDESKINIELNDNLIQFCEDNYLESKMVKNFLNRYKFYVNKIRDYEAKEIELDYDKKENYIDLKWFDENLKIPEIPNNISNKLSKSFLHGYYYNIAVRVIDDNYLLLLNPDIKYIYKIKTINPNTNIKDTLLPTKNIYIGSTLLYLTKDADGQISVISNIFLKDVQSILSYIYNDEFIKRFKPSTSTNKDITDLSVYSKYNSTIENIKNELQKYYNNNWKEYYRDIIFKPTGNILKGGNINNKYKRYRLTNK